MTKTDVQEILEKMDAGKLGTIVKRTDRPSYADLYKASFPKKETPYKPRTIEAQKHIQTALSVVISGSAGEGVQFAAKNLIECGLRHGLNVMQKNDNPVTIGTGFSFSEVKLSSEEILYSGITEPDYIVISSIDGLKRANSMVNGQRSTVNGIIIIDSSLEAELEKLISVHRSPSTVDQIIIRPFRKLAKDPQNTNLLMLGYLFKLVPELDLELFIETIQANGKNTEKIIEVVRLGYSLE
jgi:Pyruvate/2-oxoacid:ferredoxin oxidoreductase gamma subunit